MASNRLPVGHISGKEASQSYTCSGKYQWHNLAFNQSEQATRGQSHHVANTQCPRHMSSRTGRYTAFHGHGHSSEICGPGNGVDGPGHLSSTYVGCHGQDRACPSHSSKRARRSISPGPGSEKPYGSKRSPSFGHVQCYAKGPDRDIREAVSCRKKFSVNQVTCCQNRHYHEDRYPPTKNDFPSGLFSEKDAARHRTYMQSFHAYNKHYDQNGEDPISNIFCTSHGQLRQRDEVVRDHCKRPIHEFHAIRDEQLELSPYEDSECLETNRNFRNAYNSNVVKRKWLKQGSHKSTYNGASASKYGRNSRLKRNADHLDGTKARTNVAYEDKSKRLCSPDGQDQQLQVEPEEMRNDILEGNAERIKSECPNGAKGNCNSKKNALTVHASSGSRKWNENSNMLSLKCNSKTIASLNTPKLSEGSKSMDLESDKESGVEGCPKGGIVQNLSVAHLEKSVQPKGSGNLSYSEVRRDCLELWRARRLRKNSASEADTFLIADQQHTAQRSKMSTGGRVRNGRPAAFPSSESDEDDSVSESSDQFSSVKSSEELTKHCEERANKKLEWDPSRPSIRKYDKSIRNMTAEEALMCSMEPQPAANTGEVVLQNEQEKLLCDQTDCKAQTRPSDISKVDHTVITHPDNGVPQNVSHQGADNEVFNERKKDRLRCQNENGTETTGTELAEKLSLCTGPIPLDQNMFAIFPKHEILKVNASQLPKHGSGSTTFNGSELDRGAVNKGQKRPVRSCESYCRDFKNWLYGNGHIDIKPETMNCNILRKKQELSALAESGNKMNQKATKEDFRALQILGVSSNEQISHHCTSDTANSGAPNRDDWILCPSIPDLNCLPSMVAVEGSVPSEEPVYQVDEDSFPSEELVCQVDEGSVPSKELVCQVDECCVPSEELVCQVATYSSKPQLVTKSLSNSLIAPAMKEEQVKQAEPAQFVGEVCEKGTSESAGRVQISDSNTGPPQLSTAAESSTTIDAFKIALCEYIKNILKPLCEDGPLTREVHKIIVKKAVEKVAGVWGSSAPSTEMAISRVLSDESQNLYKLVQGYLELYVGRGVLKKYALWFLSSPTKHNVASNM